MVRVWEYRGHVRQELARALVDHTNIDLLLGQRAEKLSGGTRGVAHAAADGGNEGNVWMDFDRIRLASGFDFSDQGIKSLADDIALEDD